MQYAVYSGMFTYQIFSFQKNHVRFMLLNVSAQ
jgi:hypothetical protein